MPKITMYYSLVAPLFYFDVSNVICFDLFVKKKVLFFLFFCGYSIFGVN